MTITACFKTDDGKVFDSFDAAQLHECFSQTNVYLEEWKEKQLLSIITDHFFLETKPSLKAKAPPADIPSTESPENE